MDVLEKLEELEKGAECLEPGPEEREALMKKAMQSAEHFLVGLQSLDSKVFTKASGKSTSDILNDPLTDEGSSFDDILELFENGVLKSGVETAHAMHLGFVPGGGLFPSAIGDFLTAVTNKYAGVFYVGPEVVRLESKLIAWTASLFGYPSNHAGNLASGGTASTLIALATARDSMNIKGRDYERTVVYLTEMTHNCLRKAMKVLGMTDAIIREVPIKEETMEMDVGKLKEIIEADIQKDLKPFLVAASVGNGLTGTVDPIDEIADVTEEYKLWFHVDAAYGGFFVLVDDFKHLFKGIDRSDSIILDPHKGLFLPYGSGMLLVRDGKKLFEANSLLSTTNILQDAGVSDRDTSPCDLSFELTKHSRGLRMWLPLKLFGVKAFATALEEKLVLAKYFHWRISSIDGFVAKPYPQLSIVVFYYDTKDDEITDKFNRELQSMILEDGRLFISAVTVGGKYHLRICVLNFRTHRKHIDLCLQIIEENTNVLKAKFDV
ncbi:tryptophan decarboxylase-like [Ptychodera flava]|uniref:tryptophan decarboxylase-like n=1 Tax=Ptychodera flava TaxID=63121 RepID=UPI00396A31D2